MKAPFYTVGHSTRDPGEFLEILKSVDVAMIVDVRTMPRSRTNPAYNAEALPETLSPFGIGYRHIPELGGLRGRDADVGESVNGFWKNRSFHNYADYALSARYEEGYSRLVALGRDCRCAIMCAEAVWWRCHRRIIADHLLCRGEAVFHLMGVGKAVPAKLTAGAVCRTDGKAIYPQQCNGDPR